MTNYEKIRELKTSAFVSSLCDAVECDNCTENANCWKAHNGIQHSDNFQAIEQDMRSKDMIAFALCQYQKECSMCPVAERCQRGGNGFSDWLDQSAGTPYKEQQSICELALSTIYDHMRDRGLKVSDFI
jgi:hypothetical protein